MTLDCNHKFHMHCAYTRGIESGRTCPICKRLNSIDSKIDNRRDPSIIPSVPAVNELRVSDSDTDKID